MGYNDNVGVYHAFHEFIALPLVMAREATAGDVGAITANGGLLASDTTPALSGTGSTVSQEALWAASNNDQILWDVPLPEDFDGRSDAYVELLVASGGTTNLASFTVASSFDGGANISDTATDPAASTTYHRILATISKDDIPDTAMTVSIALTPAAHTTDTVAVKAARFLYSARAT